MEKRGIVELAYSKREIPKPLAFLTTLTALFMAIYHFYTGLYGPPYPQIHRFIHLFGALIITLIIYPYSKKVKSFKKFEYLLLASLFALGLFFTINLTPERILERGMYGVNLWEIIAGIILIAFVLELTRRTVGAPLAIVASIFIAYIFLGPYLPFLYHKGYGLERFIEYQVWTLEGLFSIPIGVSASFVILFIIFGALLEELGAARFFIDLAYAIAGRSVGGPAKVAVVASALMGTVSGSAVSNVVTTGTFTIPLMKKVGYKPDYAAAVEAVASTGGQFMPPVMGAAAFVMAEFLGIPYWKVAVAAALPAILYYLSLGTMIHLEALKMGIKPIEISGELKVSRIILNNIHLLIPIIVLIYYLFVVQASPALVAAYTILSLIIVGSLSTLVREKRFPYREILRGLIKGAMYAAPVALACASAGIIIGVITLTGLGVRLARLIPMLSHGIPLLGALLTMIVCIILGMGVPTTAAYIITVTLAGPALIHMGVNIFAAHLFVLYFAVLSFITPPVAIAAYAASGISGSDPMRTGFIAWRLGLAGFIVPFIYIFDQSLLLMGAPSQIISTFARGIVGVVALAIAIEGYFKGTIGVIERAMYFISSIAILTPANLHVNALGLLLFAVLASLRIVRAIKHKTPLH